MSKVTNPKTLWLVCRIVESLVLIVTGVLAIIYAQNSTMQKVVFILLGVFIVLDAVIRIIRYYVDPNKNKLRGRGILVATIQLSVGLVLCIKPSLLPEMVNELLVLFLAVLLFSICVVLICDGVSKCLVNGFRGTRAVLISTEFIVAILLLVGGILLLVYKETPDLVSIAILIAGVLLVILGILLIVDGFSPLDRKFNKVAEHSNAKK